MHYINYFDLLQSLVPAQIYCVHGVRDFFYFKGGDDKARKVFLCLISAGEYHFF